VTNHQHKLVRALRVTWTAAFSLLTPLLIALWLRSYSHRDQTRGCIFGSRHHILVTSLRDQIAVGYDERGAETETSGKWLGGAERVIDVEQPASRTQ
jgi:hypothetical protein